MAVDLASEAAAVTAGYVKIQIDKGATKSPRYTTIQQKNLVGEPGRSGALWRAYGESDVQATADSNALAALNVQRGLRYAKGSADTGKGAYGGSLTDDLH
jgi:hypothetical protein